MTTDRTLKDEVLRYLRECRSITVKECVSEIGTTELRKIISDLIADGVKIKKEHCVGKNRYGRTTHFNRYSLED